MRPRLFPSVGVGDRLALVVDVERQRAAHAAVRADRLGLAQLGARADRHLVDRLVRQRPGRASSDALAARDAGRLAHRVVEVEGDARLVALAHAADDLVVAHLVAAADAAIAQDTGGVIHHDAQRGRVFLMRRGKSLRKARCAYAITLGECLQFAIARLLFARTG